MLDCFRLDSTACNKVGRTSESGLVPIEVHCKGNLQISGSVLINTVLVSGLSPTGPPPWSACRVATPFSMLLCTVATWTWCSGSYMNTNTHPLSPCFVAVTDFAYFVLNSLKHA